MQLATQRGYSDARLRLVQTEVLDRPHDSNLTIARRLDWCTAYRGGCAGKELCDCGIYVLCPVCFRVDIPGTIGRASVPASSRRTAERMRVYRGAACALPRRILEVAGIANQHPAGPPGLTKIAPAAGEDRKRPFERHDRCIARCGAAGGRGHAGRRSRSPPTRRSARRCRTRCSNYRCHRFVYLRISTR